MLRIGIDLGGTKIAAGLVDENRVLGPSIQEPTGLPRPAGELAEAIYHLTYRLLKGTGTYLSGCGKCGDRHSGNGK